MRPAGATSAATRERIRDASARLFAKQGYAATGIREIAAAAGVTSSSLYEHFGSKDDLLVEIMRASIEPLLAVARQLRRAGAPPAERLAALVGQHVRFHVTNPDATLVSDTEVRALEGDRRAAIVALRDQYEREWRLIVAAGARCGAFDVADHAVTARALLALCTGVVAWYRPRGAISVDKLCAMHVTLALSTVRAN